MWTASQAHPIHDGCWGPMPKCHSGWCKIGPDNQGNRWMGGYEYAISSVSAFSHLHAWTMGGLSMMPATADFTIDNPRPDAPYKGANAGYHSRILKETEKAFPGYYEVELYDHKPCFSRAVRQKTHGSSRRTI